jgi:putative serine protease PepD
MTTPSQDGSPRTNWQRWALIAAGVVIVGGVLIGVFTPSSGRQAGATASACPVTDIAPAILPSVVTITATNGPSGGTGSGEVIRSDGYILTNNHVVSLAADGGSVEVLFSDGKSAPATITGRDPKTDLAVIKVNNQSELPVIPIGKSSDLVVGQGVVALGAPLGLSETVTSGIVSALGRTIEVPGDNNTTALLVSAIQTDAAINPGNSGGALVDCSGRMVGIPSAGATAPISGVGGSSTGSIGLGFAIPIDNAIPIANEIIATGSVTHSYFGIVAVTMPASAAKQAGVESGLYVQAVVPGGPSEQAGLRMGDIITAIDGKPATSTQQLQEITLTKKPGDTVTLTYQRAGQSAKATVTLGTQP